ncbi:MAG: hypothetical protein IJB34_03935 [Clostridia bacterium]|nr:hypothetical protein [Clostridia bacterium]
MLNLERKKVTLIQVIVCVAASVLMFVLSLFPVASLQMKGNAMHANIAEVVELAEAKALAEADEANVEAIEKQFEAYYEKLDAVEETGAGYEIKPAIFKTVFSFPKAIKVMGCVYAVNTVKNATENETDLETLANAAEKLANIDPSAVTDGALETAYLLTGLISKVNVIGPGGYSTFSVGGLVNLLLSGIFFLIAAIVFPIVMFVYALKTIIQFLANRKDPAKIYGKVSCNVNQVFIGLPLFFLLALYFPESSTTATVIVMTVIASIVVAVNVLGSRMKTYTPNETKYLNVMQIVTTVALIGSVLFMCTVGNANVGGFLLDSETLLAAVETKEAFSDWQKVEMTLGMISFAISLFYMFPFIYFSMLLSRVACMNVPAKKQVKDTNIGMTVIGVLTFIAPLVVFNMYGLEFPSEQNGALIAYGIGAIIMFLAEVVFIILKKKLIPDLTEEQINAVRYGRSVLDSVDTATVEVATTVAPSDDS